ncbi:MAG: tRNA 2-thiouridine(34) synthase MnmA [Alphaproteobacteria bacterium]|nr:tRNA 2-thiouridine(34) synthase MnmA [Alphaproteobacteria bacterium]
MNQAVTLAGVPPGARVAVAMSGGVDSSAVAALLRRAGYEVVGLTMQLYDHRGPTKNAKSCCAGIDVHDARRVADTLGIRHYVLDYEARFERAVIEPFAASYARGETPIPCVLCNQTVKFTDMLGAARTMGAAALATGHYVQRRLGPSGIELHRSLDPARDQSYFLFATTVAQLKFVHFPLGGLTKRDTRRIAADAGLLVADKPDSQDICFVPSGDYAAVVAHRAPGTDKEGEIVHLDGRVLGRHHGIAGFTVGQRKGLGIGGPAGGGEPLYVLRIDALTHRVVVGPRRALQVARIALREVNWLGADAGATTAVQVRVRSTQVPVPAELTLGPDRSALVTLASPELGVAPGQACVFSDGSRVLGGGWIAATEPAALAA